VRSIQQLCQCRHAAVMLGSMLVGVIVSCWLYRLRHFANHLEGAHYTLRKRVTALSDDHQKLYNIPSIPLQERRDKVFNSLLFHLSATGLHLK